MKLKNQGVVDYRQYWHDELAYNYRMTNICAAIGVAQLERAPDIIRKKQQIADWYAESLRSVPVTLHRAIGDVVHSYWMNCILIPEAGARDSLREHLARVGIETRPVFYPVHTMPVYYSPDVLPERRVDSWSWRQSAKRARAHARADRANRRSDFPIFPHVTHG